MRGEFQSIADLVGDKGADWRRWLWWKKAYSVFLQYYPLPLTGSVQFYHPIGRGGETVARGCDHGWADVVSLGTRLNTD
jgi:hypothetical protein